MPTKLTFLRSGLLGSPESLEWGPFEGLGPDIVEGVRRIKSQDSPGLVAGPLKTG